MVSTKFSPLFDLVRRFEHEIALNKSNICVCVCVCQEGLQKREEKKIEVIELLQGRRKKILLANRIRRYTQCDNNVIESMRIWCERFCIQLCIKNSINRIRKNRKKNTAHHSNVVYHSRDVRVLRVCTGFCIDVRDVEYKQRCDLEWKIVIQIEMWAIHHWIMSHWI